MAKDNKSGTKAPESEAPQTQAPQGEQTQQTQGEQSRVPDGTTILRKMSPKTVMGKIKRPNPGDPDATPPVPPDPERDLYVVMGQTNGLVTGESDNGPWTAFKGWFESARCDTGEIAQSGLCFVPKAFEELLVNAVKAQQGGDAGAMVEFAVKISIVTSTKAGAGYEFRCKNLVKVQSGDPLKALRDSLRSSGSLPALPAPKAAA